MKITVYLESEEKTKVVNASTVREILEKLKINLTTIIIVRDDEVITEDTKLKANDKIKLLSVISGG